MAVLILTAYDDPIWIEELLKAGAQGYVVKSDDLTLHLAEAIRAVSVTASVYVRLSWHKAGRNDPPQHGESA